MLDHQFAARLGLSRQLLHDYRVIPGDPLEHRLRVLAQLAVRRAQHRYVHHVQLPPLYWAIPARIWVSRVASETYMV